MLWIIQFLITLIIASKSSAEYGDLRLTEGDSDSDGAVEFDTGDGDWIPICRNGFDDNAGDVACKQLGYKQSDELSTYQIISFSGDYTAVCHINCNGGENKITDCDIKLGCQCSRAVGVDCSDPDDNNSDVAIIIIILVCVAVSICATPCCIICSVRVCARYRSNNTDIVYRVVARQRAPQQVAYTYMNVPTATATTTSINNATYDEAPPAYVPYSDYQPCAAEAPPPIEDPDQ